MAEIWGAALVAVGTAYGAKKQGDAAEDAARARQEGPDAAVAEHRRQFDLTRGDNQPFLQLGQDAAGRIGQLNQGDFSSFYEDPGYQFRQDQGLKTLDRSAAARGGLFGGGHSQDLMRFGQGLASQEYGNFYNRLAGQAGIGQTTASNLGSLGANMANQIGAQYNNAGNARASSYLSQGDTSAQLGAGLAGAFNNWYQGNRANNPGGTPWYLGNNPGRG